MDLWICKFLKQPTAVYLRYMYDTKVHLSLNLCKDNILEGLVLHAGVRIIICLYSGDKLYIEVYSTNCLESMKYK